MQCQILHSKLLDREFYGLLYCFNRINEKLINLLEV